jgi:hypothetical protein
MSSYIPIASQTLTSAASTVTFSSIPTALNGKTLRDLVFVTELQPSTTATLRLIINADGGAKYNWVLMRGLGSSPQSENAGGFSQFNIINLDPTFSKDIFATFTFFDYAQTNKHKSILSTSKNSELTQAHAMRFADTAAINQIALNASSGNLAVGSTFSLYGIEG